MLMARPSILNEELISKFEEKLSQGLPVKYTCDILEINKPLFYMWLERGEDDIEKGLENNYTLFFTTIKKAQATFVDNSIKDIHSGRPGWQGIAWILERTRPDFAPPKSDSNINSEEKVIVKPGVKK